MARYYFHIREGDRLIHDEEGVDLSDLHAAKRGPCRVLASYWPKPSRPVSQAFRMHS